MRIIKLALLFVLASSTLSYAADHLDGVAILDDPAADITDTYAWLQNQQQLNLILNVFPNAQAESKFSNQIQYVFHVSSLPAYGAAADKSIIICTFNVNQLSKCTLGKADNLAASRTLIENQDASIESGVVSADNKFKLFTGLRNDPFFFDIENFNITRQAVRDAASSLTFDTAGCPALDSGTRDALVGALTGTSQTLSNQVNVPPVDTFRNFNALSIVIQADRDLFGAGPIYSVWASTHSKS